MNIRDLEYIVAVDELKSFVKASKKCFVSQPALSMQIQKIENILEIKIFERTKKSVMTTENGEKFLHFANEILKNFTSIKSIKNDAMQLKIGLIPTVAPYLLSKIISKMEERFEGIKFFFTEEKTAHLTEMLAKGDLDMLIIAEENDKMEKKYPFAEYNDLYFEPFYMCAKKNKIFIKNKEMTENEFQNIVQTEKIILLEEGNCMTDTLNQICSFRTSSNMQSDFFATSIETIKHMVALGNGFSILPKLSILSSDIGLSYFKLPNNRGRKIGSLFRKNTLKREKIEDVNSLMKSEIVKLL